MTQINQRTVLFADLRGSTSLYETLGNARATTVVTQSVSLIARVVKDCDGTVIKTLGDGLMALFRCARRGGAGGRPDARLARAHRVAQFGGRPIRPLPHISRR